MNNDKELANAIIDFANKYGNYPKAIIFNSKYLNDMNFGENGHSSIPYFIDNRIIETFYLVKNSLEEESSVIHRFKKTGKA